MVRLIAKSKWRVFMMKADEFLGSARDAIKLQAWNASVSGSVHAGILACNVLTVGTLGKRNAGQHDDIVVLLPDALAADPKGLRETDLRIRRLLAIKNVAEYEDRSVDAADAAACLKDAQRLVEFARAKTATFAK